MEDNFKSICTNCFSDQMRGEACTSCGYHIKNARKNSLAVPEFTILNSRYLVGRIIGAGGFGITYKAYDTVNNSICAIKEYVPLGLACRKEDCITLTEVSEEKKDYFTHGKKRFYEEAKALYDCSKIPDVVEILDYFKDNNTVYFVMDYIEGVTLKKYAVAKGGKLPVDTALTIIYKVGTALEKIHRQAGIFHRDISPDNIMITLDEEVKIIDFGSAKSIANEEQNMSVVLKPGFAPPEQYSREGRQGKYTDVYALGGTLYYILAGKTVPVAPDRVVGSEYIRLKDMDLGIDQRVSDVVDQALELNYKIRTQTVGEFINGLAPAVPSLRTIQETSNITVQEAPKEIKEPTEPPELLDKRKGTPIPYMEVQQGIMNGYRWEIPIDTPVKVGRSDGWSNIVLQGSQQISKVHFIVEYDSAKNQFYIEDKSMNGTFVDRYQLLPDKVYILSSNKIIILGAGVSMIKLGVAYDR